MRTSRADLPSRPSPVTHMPCGARNEAIEIYGNFQWPGDGGTTGAPTWLPADQEVQQRQLRSLNVSYRANDELLRCQLPRHHQQAAP
jgi:hypothetical protein